MRKAEIFYNNSLAGVLTETDEGEYIFEYDKIFIKENPNHFLTFTMPVREEPYVEKHLFAFFEGLIPEGWLLDIASKNWKINRRDRMGLLLACCKSCIGAVSVYSIAEGNEE
ncbi:phosphatidylinositol kinase [Antarcticibacterium arcticum]|uniref:Phosphatidylinositol kinase n=1 Tax=Antarcticibacterium arcticum TaxID=2585771 RepID=A0A5B8YIQ4_9FLAO|nr:HipA N-terminal domain-containing protein [Antarcticibacterium arcticum]QED36717.1 phosphatidylinositol kinase [Antarcticibacterium arcticum]